MGSTIRSLKTVLAIGFLWPTIVGAVPIIAPPVCFCAGISGWANDYGNFEVDWHSASLATTSDANYTLASSLFSQRSSLISFNGGDTHFTLTPGDLRLDVIVQEDGTISGNLLGGILTVTADADGIPEAGIAGGETLLVGHAIDAAALDEAFSVVFLFALTYTHPAFASLGDYVTYEAPYPVAWHTDFVDGAFVSNPWGVSWGGGHGFTNTDFVRTTKVPEPSSLALLSLGLVSLALRHRRKPRT